MNKKEKIQFIKKVLKHYKDDQCLLIKIENQNLYPMIHYQEMPQSSYSKETYLLAQLHFKDKLQKRIHIIEASKETIGQEYYHILFEDYYYENKNWWKGIYSRATYYRHQEQAIDAFYDYLTSLL